ncbi:hypothetical protein ABK040_004726 [Willaertia magna]
MFSTVVNTLESCRSCGKVHCYFGGYDEWPDVINHLQRKFKYFTTLPQPIFNNNNDTASDDENEDYTEDGNELELIDQQIAIKIIQTIYSYDLAYRVVLKSSQRSLSLAQSFVECFGDKITFFYTNGYFNELKLQSSTNITEATFDRGVLAVSENTFGYVWIEDED